jgi:hypothetical protein
MPVHPLSWHNILIFAAALALMAWSLPALATRVLHPTDAADWRVVRAIGLGLLPFALGLSSIAVLALLPQASDTTHAVAPLALAVALAMAARRQALDKGGAKSVAPHLATSASTRWLGSAAMLAIALGALLVLATPLSENDALEHALVGRELYTAGELAAYPILDTAMASGIYAPWSHPPLYSALIVQSYALQGSAETATLMRAIAPLFLLAAVLLTYALAARHSPVAGWIASLIVLSTPLLGRSTIAGGIDALPVAGLVLALAPLTLQSVTPMRRALATGLCLGLALLTHAQAVIFVPMIAAAAWAGLPLPAAQRLRGIAALLGLALLIGGWPYWRNFQLFGVVVSDMPAVFALPQLGWDAYFRLARDLDSPVARLQFGVLKGWFSLASFGAAFWLLLLATLGSGLGRSQPAMQQTRTLLTTSVLLIALYHLFLLLTALAGFDLMIRNDRYLLPLMPMVGVLAAIGVCNAWALLRQRSAQFASGWSAKAVNWPSWALGAVLALALAAGFALQWYGALAANRVTSQSILASADAQAARLPSLRLMRTMADLTPPDAVVLSLRPADMYYAHRKMVSYIDPRLIAFYRQTDPERAFATLTTLGVTHVHVPDYSLPVDYNSQLPQLLSSPRFARLLSYDSGYALYELVRGEAPAAFVRPLSSEHDAWATVETFDPSSATILRPSLARRVLERGERHLMISTRGGPPASALAAPITVPPETELRIELPVSGRGFARLHLLEFDGAQRLLTSTRLAEAAIDANGMTLSRRFMTSSATRGLRLAIEASAETEPVRPGTPVLSQIVGAPR